MTIPETNNPPWDQSDIEGSFCKHDGYKIKKTSDPKRMIKYIRKLIVWLSNMYESIANAINENSKHYLGGEIPDISTSQSIWDVVQSDGYISKVSCVIYGSIATSDATITVKVAGATIMTLAIPYSGSAAGDVVSDKPDDVIAVSEGDNIEISTDGASTNAVKSKVRIEMIR